MPKSLQHLFVSLFLVLIANGCAVTTNNYATRIAPKKLEKRGMIVGRVTFEDTNRGTKLGNLLMMNAQPRFTAKNSFWHGVSTTITGGAKKGYFAIPVKPDTYTLDSLQLSPGFTRPLIQSMSVCCFGERFKQVPIGAGEIVYLGDIHFAEAVEYFSSKNPIEKSRISKGLLLDPSQKEAASVGSVAP